MAELHDVTTLQPAGTIPDPEPAQPINFPPPRARRGRGAAKPDAQQHMSEVKVDNVDLRNLLMEFGKLSADLEDDEDTAAKRKRLRAVRKAIKSQVVDVLGLENGQRYRVADTGYVIEPTAQPGATVTHNPSTKITITSIE